jgi:hypothetical protein
MIGFSSFRWCAARGVVREPIFRDFFPCDHVIIDELHLFLRIADQLLSKLFIEAFAGTTTPFSKSQVEKRICSEFRRIGVKFQFYSSKGSVLQYTTLMGATKYKVLCNLNIGMILGVNVPHEKVVLLESIWNGFRVLYDRIHSTESFNDQEIAIMEVRYLARHTGK